MIEYDEDDCRQQREEQDYREWYENRILEEVNYGK